MLSLIRSIIHIGKTLTDIPVNEQTEIEIVFDKSVIIDENAEREQDRQDMRDGIMPKWEYRMKWYGDTENDAKGIISEINKSLSDDDLMGFTDEGDA